MPGPQNAPYSSLAAFLAHYRTLRAAPSRSADEERLFGDMVRLVRALPEPEFAALDTDPADPATRRHRERAELRLSRALVASGMLAG